MKLQEGPIVAFFSVLLLLIAWVLKLVLSPVLFVYGLIKSLKMLSLDYFRQLAVAIDVLGNVMGQHLFNDILRKEGGYDFGNRHDTISFALAKNREMGKLTRLGEWLGKKLDQIDPGHLQKALDSPNAFN